MPQVLDITGFLTISGRSHFLQKTLFYPSAISRKLAELILAVGHFPGSFAKISKLTEITFVKNHQISEKSSVLLNLVRCWNSVHPLDDFFAQCRLLRLWKVMRVCLWIAWPSAFLFIVVRQVLQQLWLLIALMVRNPIKHTISGAMTGLWQA